MKRWLKSLFRKRNSIFFKLDGESAQYFYCKDIVTENGRTYLIYCTEKERM